MEKNNLFPKINLFAFENKLSDSILFMNSYF